MVGNIFTWKSFKVTGLWHAEVKLHFLYWLEHNTYNVCKAMCFM